MGYTVDIYIPKMIFTVVVFPGCLNVTSDPKLSDLLSAQGNKH